MAIAVASSNNVGYGASAVITKPTGLAVDDLLVAALASPGGSIALPAGWTDVVAVQQGTVAVRIVYKIADSSDVAASNFTFTVGAGTICGTLLRVTGAPSTEAVAYIDHGSGDSTTSTTTPTFGSQTIDPEDDGSLLVMIIASGNTGGGETHSTYLVNGTNPTWTEYLDANEGGGNTGVGAAAAVQATTAQITSFQLTISASANAHAGILAVFTPTVDVTGNIPLAEDNGEVFAVAGKAGVKGNIPLIEDNGEVFPVAGNIEQPTRYSNKAKSSTSWVNKDKN